jgi:hypothetical protein
MTALNKYANAGIIIAPKKGIFMELKERPYYGEMLPIQHYVIAANLICKGMDPEIWNRKTTISRIHQELFDYVRIIMFRTLRHPGEKDVRFLGTGLLIPEGFKPEPPIRVLEIEEFMKSREDRFPALKPSFLRFEDENGKLIAPDL